MWTLESVSSFLAVALLLPSSSFGFVVQPTRQVATLSSGPSQFNFNLQQRAVLLQMSADGGEATAPKRKRKRKKKVAESPATPEPPTEKAVATPPPPTIVLKPRDDSPVQFQVQDVREVIGGIAPTSPSRGTAPAATSAGVPSVSAPASFASLTSAPLDDSLARLLEDAREMKDVEGEPEEKETSVIKETIGKALSTIVTADFFLVLAFLAWFLAGIFCSYILKDDTVQIAFNSNFQAFVQPALGVLMIGAGASVFFKEEDGEDMS